MDITLDVESTGLLNASTIDYTASPYQLKPDYKLHCICVEEHETGKLIGFHNGEAYILDGRPYIETVDGVTYTLEHYEPIEYEHRPLSEFKDYVLQNKPHRVVAHNGINFDFLVIKLLMDMEFTVEEDTWCGLPVSFEDTLVTSKTLNPDRFGGHSLDAWGERVGLKKIHFRPSHPQEEKFKHFAADMLYYCFRDAKVNTKVYKHLEAEKGEWNWKPAIALEKAVAEIITYQLHRGFKFDSVLAEKNIKELDVLMEERRQRVEPLLPKRPATKKFMADFTPPKVQFKKDGGISANMEKFIAKIGAEFDAEKRTMLFNGKTYKLPLAPEPLITEMDATIDDTTHIKNWLVGLGWVPSEYKEKDLTVDAKKNKLTKEKYEAAVERYVEQTLSSNFCTDRCEHLNVSKKMLRAKLLNSKTGRAVKVLTNPSLTKGQDKEMCPDLERISEQFPYAKDVVEYLTYKHRRNSILGGGLDWDDDEEPEKGYVANVRPDGRISTPADTCGAATSRFKHREVANIPRVSSLYGGPMRAMFGVDTETSYQIGYDFDSLEARIESHYCWKYDKAKDYCNSLLLDKPFDVHTRMAQSISEIIGRDFGRQTAKNVKYGCTYGAQAAKVAKTIGSDMATGNQVFDAFWEAADPLAKLKVALQKYWENVGGKKFILGIDGRKVPTRSQHAILNSLFQSAGVICAKRAMVIHDRKLRAEGLRVDFFKDDWRNKLFCQQMIAYHK